MCVNNKFNVQLETCHLKGGIAAQQVSAQASLQEDAAATSEFAWSPCAAVVFSWFPHTDKNMLIRIIADSETALRYESECDWLPVPHVHVVPHLWPSGIVPERDKQYRRWMELLNIL